MQIFTFVDEIEVISCFLNENSDVKALKSKMAAAAGCQLSYLSQAMAGKVHLTPDHGYGIAKFLRLGEAETEYFMLLVQFKRAGSREHRNYISERLNAFRKANFNLETKIKSSGRLSDSDLQRYYSDWRLQAIHMFLTIPKYQRLNPLATKFKVDEIEILALLDILVALGLAKKVADSWFPILKELHIPIRSPHSIATQFQWKMRALQDLQGPEGSGVHYVGTFSLSNHDIQELKAMVIDFIAKTRALAKKSPEEEVAHLGLSFFAL